MMADKPFAAECRNDNRDDFWTSPCCYRDLGNVKNQTVECPDCGRKVRCTVEQMPTCLAVLEDGQDSEEDDE